MCPRSNPDTAKLRDNPETLARYPQSLALVCDFERDRIVYQTVRAGTEPGVALGEVPANGAQYDPGCFSPLRHGYRSADIVEQIRGLGARWFVANMYDAAPYPPEIYFGHKANILQYNRRRGDTDAVLWRLPSYFEPTPMLGYVRERDRGPDEVAFADKRPQAVWRGGRNGQQWLSPWLMRPTETIPDPLNAEPGSMANVRWRAVMMSLAYPKWLNCRFSLSIRQMRTKDRDAPLPEHTDINRRHAWLLKFRYILCPPGNDVSTQLYWVLASNSVALRVETEYEVLPDYFIRPWVHYVPIAADLSDLIAKLEYLEANPDLCRAIVERAQAAYSAILNAPLWEESERIVLDKLGLMG